MKLPNARALQRRRRASGWGVTWPRENQLWRTLRRSRHDRREPSSLARRCFLRDAVAYYNRLGATIKRLLTDNGSAFRSKAFKRACEQLGIQQRFTRAYRPQTNGKAERFIRSALREWAYGWIYQNSAQRRDASHSWQHHYNWHRPHASPQASGHPARDITC